MPFKIIWSERAARELKKLERPTAKRIYDSVSKLQLDPYHNILRLTNSRFYRLRVGDHRVILDIQNDQLRILVLEVGHRKNIYEGS
ncbi:MAG: type II toxin-antitoxin system RelE/ParE family toxin [Candidatus Thermoplasmatota archaeon]|nr:type II toxin-antitoxin system RelE/ParE family toxin [Candidatus Thermoplasmatota archaeon]